MSRNPQAEQMADPSMLINLAAQAVAIWPQEEPLLARYSLPDHARIADIGCGSGEISARLASSVSTSCPGRSPSRAASMRRSRRA